MYDSDVPDADRKRYRRGLLSPFKLKRGELRSWYSFIFPTTAFYTEENAQPLFLQRRKNFLRTRFPNTLLRSQGKIREFWFATLVYFIFLVQLSDEAILLLSDYKYCTTVETFVL